MIMFSWATHYHLVDHHHSHILILITSIIIILENAGLGNKKRFTAAFGRVTHCGRQPTVAFLLKDEIFVGAVDNGNSS